MRICEVVDIKKYRKSMIIMNMAAGKYKYIDDQKKMNKFVGLSGYG